MTKRIERDVDDPSRYQRRELIVEDAWNVSYLNYSLFLHLTAAYDHLPGPMNSSFGDFYSHLGSACDLAEELVLKVYILRAECTGGTVDVLQGLAKEEFLKLAAAWYDEHYPNLYEHYLKYGKGKPPIPIPGRKQVIREYYTGRKEWKAYATFVEGMKRYRNRIVHDVAMGNVLVGKIHMVPRKECIQSYRSLQQVESAAQDVERLKKDFIVREEQMADDFRTLQQHFNALWEKPIGDLTKLLYEDKNAALMAKYNLLLT